MTSDEQHPTHDGDTGAERGTGHEPSAETGNGATVDAETAAAPATRRDLRAAQRTRLLAEQQRLRREQAEIEAAAAAPAAPTTESDTAQPTEAASGVESHGVAAETGASSPQPQPDSGSPVSETDAAATASAEDPFAEIFGDESVGAHQEDHEQQRRKRRKRRVITSVVVLLALAIIGGVAVAAWNFAGERIMELFDNEPIDYEGAGNGTEVEFTIMPGDTGTEIGGRLEEAGVVRTSKAFVQAILARPDEPQFHPGTYRLQAEMSADHALVALMDRENRIENTLTIPEGTRESTIYTLIEETYGVPVTDLEKLAEDPQQFGLPEEAESLEGFLFPATYTFAPGTEGEDILKAMVDRSFQALDEHGVAEEDRWDIVRMASLVEREARLAEDFPRVARVFYNRLEIDMLLQSDATVTYWTEQTHRASTTDKERQDASNPYNTYVHKGLIPRPISNPGDVAIDAAVNPADGEWLYFVTVNLETGETVFSNTHEEHEKARDQWLKWLEENPDYE